jgi:hypothetical protein
VDIACTCYNSILFFILGSEMPFPSDPGFVFGLFRLFGELTTGLFRPLFAGCLSNDRIRALPASAFQPSDGPIYAFYA